MTLSNRKTKMFSQIRKSKNFRAPSAHLLPIILWTPSLQAASPSTSGRVCLCLQQAFTLNLKNERNGKSSFRKLMIESFSSLLPWEICSQLNQLALQSLRSKIFFNKTLKIDGTLDHQIHGKSDSSPNY